jgi:cyclopropane-fatty-acyl-phospholipid synthase
MKNGRLVLRLPEGGRFEFGEGRDGPQAEIQLHNDRFFSRGVLGGKVGLGEGYQAGDWDSPDLTSVIGWFCSNMDGSPTRKNSLALQWTVNWLGSLERFRHAWNRNTLEGSRRNIRAHYDLGNRFYRLWLDPTMSYSSALFEFPDQELEAAQAAKYERLCRKLRIGSNDHVLEVGCGWGGFLSHAIRTRGCRVTAITISEEQKRYTQERMEREGLSDRARIELLDYRRIPSLKTQFDKIVSIEMLEAVGDEYLEECLSILQSALAPAGLLGAQFIICPDSRHQELRRSVDWIQKHIFPGSLLLSLDRTGEAIRRSGDLWMHDLEDIGLSYAETLRRWRLRFTDQLDEVRRLGFDDYFIRTWSFYLAYCEAAFAWRNISVVQAVWSRPNNRCLMTPEPSWSSMST